MFPYTPESYACTILFFTYFWSTVQKNVMARINYLTSLRRITLIILFFTPAFQVFSQANIDSLLNSLHKSIANRNLYIEAKLQRIEKLGNELAGIESKPIQEQFDTYNKLYHEYKVFIYDSAFNYALHLIRISREMNDASKVGYARVKLGFILVSSGMFKETFDSLEVVNVRQLPDSTRVEYYTLMARAFYDLGVYNNDRYYNSAYTVLGHQYMDSARLHCEPGSYQFLYISGLKNLKSMRFKEAVADLQQLLEEFELTLPQRAVNCHNLSFAYLALGENDKAIEYMVKASLADLEAATKETAAMYTLAKLLYEKKDIKNAYPFIEQAMEDALYYGAKQRKVEIGSILPVIAAQKLNTTEEQRKLWLGYSITLTILAILVLAFAFIIVKQLKKLKMAETTIRDTNKSLQETNHRLEEANTIKEEYIGYYFNINSEYLDKIETFKKSIDTKLIAKKYDDIRFVVNNIDLRKEREALYVSFDKVFLKLFPDFVTRFNSYFDEKDKVILKDGELLNTELRIFALIRMGISDTEKIAKILGYSVNTIYAYKTRIRNKSLLPNDEFDLKIMEIKTT